MKAKQHALIKVGTIVFWTPQGVESRVVDMNVQFNPYSDRWETRVRIVAQLPDGNSIDRIYTLDDLIPLCESGKIVLRNTEEV